jgi:DivIVA domain-containing protein
MTIARAGTTARRTVARVDGAAVASAAMELERRNIQKRDFAPARKGYETDEVDRHLREIADAVEQLKAAQPKPESLAGAAASRVESIVAAAEASAREIEDKARADAAEHVRRADESVDRLVARADELQHEVAGLVDKVTGLKAAVDAIRGDFDTAEPAPVELAAAAAEPEPAPEPTAAPAPVEPASVEPVTPASASTVPEGARVVALNMALGGKSRDETASYLRENFDLEDPKSLLDDVYAKVGG